MERYIVYLKKHLVSIIGLGLIFFLVLIATFSLRGVALTNRSFDILRTISKRNEAVIIAIDDKSLQALGAWPWDRSVFGKLINVLSDAHARSVNFDVLFLEARSGDDVLRKALGEASMPIVLASKTENGTHLPNLFVGVKNVREGLVNVYPDSDGKVRSFTLPVLTDDTCIIPLGDAAFLIATNKTASPCGESKTSFFRYPETIATYSLVDVIEGKIDPKALSGKTIFVGATSLDLLDTFIGMDGEKIPGVSIHASQFVSRLENVEDHFLSPLLTVIFLLVLSLISGYFFTTLRRVSFHGIIFVLLTFVILITSVILFDHGVMIPFAFGIALLILNLGFVSLLHIVKEQKKNAYIESLFSKYVHKDVLKELMERTTGLRFDGEKRDMTILFSDLRGFTTLSENMEPEELTRVLNGYLSAMTPCILDERGTIDKFIGDAIMAFWNAPLRIAHHEEHAVQSAIRMIAALKRFNEKEGAALAVGIGIHSGMAVVGNVGSKERINYTVLGDTVNLASRIESLTKRYGASILISDTVYEKISTQGLAIRKVDVVIVKGKNTPTTLYEIVENEKLSDIDIDTYAKAFSLYEKGDFAKAKIILKSLSDKDKAKALLLERIAALETNKAPWDGVWHYDEK